ncbi:MAG: T9SS type A sorting domain-containing protein [Flavobacteriales bacterium]
MKTNKLLATLWLLVISCSVSEAQITNAGFENWTTVGSYMEPNGWYTTNSYATGSFHPVTRDTSHFPSTVGNYSIRIENNPSLLPVEEALGTSVSGTSMSPVPSFPITGHPTSLTGYYKFLPQNGDTMSIFIVLFNNTTIVATGAFQTTAAAPNWTSFNFPISAYATANNAKIYMAAYNVSGAPPQYVPYGNSVLYVDNLNFDILINSVPAIDNIANPIYVYPNPSSGIFTIQSEKEIGQISVVNLAGEKVYQSQTDDSEFRVDLSDKPKGIYFINVVTDAGSFSKKIILD